MDQKNTIIITGAAGFIGSYLTGYLNKKGFENLILVDEFDTEEKELNLHEKKYLVRVERENLFEWLQKEKPAIDFVFHIGARTDTTEFDYAVHEKLNVEYSKSIWNYCTAQKIPLVYASSAATYGSGEFGYKDDHAMVEKLQPLNPYGISKNEFDKWALKETRTPLRGAGGPPFWAGLKFFNVYGPNEYHKGRMASMVFHGFNQIQKKGKVKLFRSHKPEYRDGEQLRDFIYVADVAAVCYWFLDQFSVLSSQFSASMPVRARISSGLYNLGTGKARSFNDLINAIYKSINIPSNIEYIDTPEDIRDKYQYFTEADMNKLREAGYKEEFFTLEEGVYDYVTHYLSKNEYY
ncbi:MAG TPA: ADP-glyceromanno-heptose 6-epimerase [Chitinophagaceae bacterium]|nr:ADP-glyceromanno-heptose 6-epimerase [Chitinophagaceae bacterium]